MITSLILKKSNSYSLRQTFCYLKQNILLSRQDIQQLHFSLKILLFDLVGAIIGLNSLRHLMILCVKIQQRHFYGFPQCYSSEGKGTLAVGSQRIPQSHTTQQTSHKRFIMRDIRGGCFCSRGSSKELNRRSGRGRAAQGDLGLEEFCGLICQAYLALFPRDR